MPLITYLSNNKIMLIDGGMGSMLQSRGLMPGMAPEWMILEQPESVVDVHRCYIDAGAEIIETNTFGATRHKLEGFGLADQAEKINKEAVTLCKKAAEGSKAYVAGSIGPIGELLAPLGTYAPEEAYRQFEEQSRFLAEAGADLINIETMSDPMELRLAVMAALSQGVPVMAEVSFMANGRMLSGTTPEVAAAILDGFPLKALGINCSLGPQEIAPLLEAMTKVTSKPMIVQPNAGIPYLENGQTVFPLGPDEFGRHVEELIKQIKPTVIGGCCGTTPSHIRVLAEIAHRYQPRHAELQMPWITGRSTGFQWTGELPEGCIRLRPQDVDTIYADTNTPYDIFGAVYYCKQNKAPLVILSWDAWNEPLKTVPEWLRNFQSYYPGALGIETEEKQMLETLLENFVGRPLVSTSIDPQGMPEVLQGIPGVIIKPN